MRGSRESDLVIYLYTYRHVHTKLALCGRRTCRTDVETIACLTFSPTMSEYSTVTMDCSIAMSRTTPQDTLQYTWSPLLVLEFPHLIILSSLTTYLGQIDGICTVQTQPWTYRWYLYCTDTVSDISLVSVLYRHSLRHIDGICTVLTPSRTYRW